MTVDRLTGYKKRQLGGEIAAAAKTTHKTLERAYSITARPEAKPAIVGQRHNMNITQDAAISPNLNPRYHA